MTSPHYHVLDGADRYVYGTYDDRRMAMKVARRIQQAEDIGARVYGACHDHHCRYGGPDAGDHPIDHGLVTK